jgi:Secretion system C-terminal sorting domain
MKKILLIILLFIFTINLHAQKDTLNYFGAAPQQDFGRPVAVNVTIYPIPVRDNSFTIKTDRDISYVRVTNIIGQDIFRFRYNSPEQQIRILLDSRPTRGMYLVTIIFSDGTRIVKKIMVEESE